MDDGANPHLGIIGRIVKFLKEMWHRLPFVQKEDVTEEEIISMVNEGHEQGVLLESEAEMIHNIFEIRQHWKMPFILSWKAAFPGARYIRRALTILSVSYISKKRLLSA